MGQVMGAYSWGTPLETDKGTATQYLGNMDATDKRCYFDSNIIRHAGWLGKSTQKDRNLTWRKEIKVDV
jgi:hypothetical protein